MSTPPSPGRGRPRVDNDALLDAAAAVFAEAGYHAATMAAIAARAGSTKPTLYAHFVGKEALHRQVLEREADRCRRWLFERYGAAAGLPLREQVAFDVRALFDYVAEWPTGFRLLFGEANAGPAYPVRAQLTAELADRVALRLHEFQRGRRARPTRIERQLAITLVDVGISGAQFAVRGETDLERAGLLAVEICMGAITHLLRLAGTPAG